MARLFARGTDDRPRRWTDLIAGVVVGLVIGLGVLVYFVFVHSEGTIDAPKVNESGGAAAVRPGPAEAPVEEAPAGEAAKEPEGEGEGEAPEEAAPPKAQPKPVPVVRVIGGAPPTEGGPKELVFHKGEKVKFEIETDEPFTFEIRGLNIRQSIEKSSIISFKATKQGQFPVIASATLIGVADLLIKSPR